MKLAQTLADYLERNKKLSLQGLGTFIYSNENIEFKQEDVIDFDDDLINFIVDCTGKMKVLAISDIQSQWDDVLQFLNTGKPYTLAGIGTLIKNQKGDFTFQQEPIEGSEKKHAKKTAALHKIPKNHLDSDTLNSQTKNKGIIVLMVLSLLAVAATIWFYLNYEKNQNKVITNDSTKNTTSKTNTKQTDTLAVAQATQPIMPKTEPTNNINSLTDYIFVLEEVKEPRASKRFSQLKRFNWPVELISTDSINFKIIMKFPKSGTDTTRIKDSLSAQNGKKVYIQQ